MVNSFHPIGEKVQEGEVLCLNHYYKVVERKISKGEPVVVVHSVTNPTERVEVSEILINQQFYSSDQYLEEVKVSPTEAENILLSAGGNVFSVMFTKQDGEERLLKGYLTGNSTAGRAQVFDCEKNGIRQVDLRTITYVILKGVKYSVKSAKKAKAKS